MGLEPMAALMAHLCWGYARTVISLADRLISTIWAVRFRGRSFSVPCFRSVANSFGRVGLDAEGNLISRGVERCFVSQDTPGHSRQLIGERDSSLVAVHAF